MQFAEPVTVDGVYVSGSNMMLMLYSENGTRVGIEVCTEQNYTNVLQMNRRRTAMQMSWLTRASGRIRK